MTFEWLDDTQGADDVRERRFALAIGVETIPGVLWTPSRPGRETPLVLAGHGYGMDKLRPYPDTLGSDLAQRGLAVAAIDLPLHGERRPSQSDRSASTRCWTAYWREFGASYIGPEFRTVARTLADAVGIDGSRMAYWGLSLGTQYGAGVLAECLSARAAVLGLFGLAEPGRWMRLYARGVTCPVYFIQQLGDEIHAGERVAALFDLLETPDKVLHASEGGHTEVPRAVFQNAYRFLAEHLR